MHLFDVQIVLILFHICSMPLKKIISYIYTICKAYLFYFDKITRVNMVDAVDLAWLV